MSIGYRGRRSRHGVEVVRIGEDGREEPLPIRLDLRSHSPAGFEWGFPGSGPAQLALALLVDCLGTEQARRFYQQFKFEVVARLPHQGCVMTRKEIEAWWATHYGANDHG